jgi:DNA-binding SARP family transcriptional activator
LVQAVRILLPRREFLLFGATCAVLATTTLLTTNTAANPVAGQQFAVEQISHEFLLRVSNPTDGVSLPSVVFIKAAELSTTSFDGAHMLAPKGQIYLTFGANAGPEQLSYGQHNWGHFFSAMTPLAPSAVTFRSSAGHRYVAHEANPVNQANNPNAGSDGGLLDATYWFLIPSDTRTGKISIGPATTEGTEFIGSVGESTTPLHVGGPITFEVSFPKQLTAPVVRRPTTSDSIPPATSALNELLSIVSFIFLGFIFWRVRRRTRRRVQYVPVFYPPTNTERPTPSTRLAEVRRPTSDDAPNPTAERQSLELRVNVLGSLQIEPSTKGASDPIRSIIAYLALHDDRPQSADEIQNALWPESMKVSSVAQKTFLNYVSRARQTVGAQYLPEANGRPGYELVNTSSDWREFRTLAASASTSSKEQATELRRSALQLVRGVPFDGESSTFFEWAVNQKYVTSMIETVTTTAHQLQADLVMVGDLDGAALAVKQAMLLAPTEMPLWRDLVDICDALGDQTLLTRFWQDAERALWPAAIKELHTRLVG